MIRCCVVNFSNSSRYLEDALIILSERSLILVARSSGYPIVEMISCSGFFNQPFHESVNDFLSIVTLFCIYSIRTSIELI